LKKRGVVIVGSALIVVAVGGSILLSKMISTVSMLDARNGHVLRTVGVGQNPLSMVIDQHYLCTFRSLSSRCRFTHYM